MGKGMAYLVLVVLGALLLWYSGLLDEFRRGSNLQARETFWREQVQAAALDGGSRAAVERFAAHHRLTLQCDAVPAGSDITECLADDPQARGGTATHPMTLQLFFMFYGDRLHTFTSTPRSLE
ncbi:hypothetical protein [Stenotrophomonas rhizophila]|uniref:hypothetical protein n=1 Tax=Stenotrophomonas rhizophila TaxID=216778 RepID=UPI0028A6EC86|nr:hypothetical protein [Stenotrophomonas rhizophila]